MASEFVDVIIRRPMSPIGRKAMKQSWATEANNDKRLKSRKQKSKNDCEDKRAWYAKSIQKYNPEWKQTAYFEGLLDGKVVQLY